MDEYSSLWEKNFSRTANKWQRKPHQLVNVDRLWLWRNCGEPVLDVGCGTCVDDQNFNDYTGVDVTPSFIRICKRNGAKAYVCDARDLGIFRDKEFATAYAKDLLLHYPQGEGHMILGEMCRVSEKAYVAWGRGGEPFNKGTNYMPSDKPIAFMAHGFWYNRYDIRVLEKEFEVRRVGEGTTITEVKRK